jgi:hypothetical protein
MSNITQFKSGGLAKMGDMAKALGGLANAAASSGTSLNGRHLLKVDKNTGDWLWGAEGDELDGDIAVNPESFQHGLVSWSGGQIGGEAMVPITDSRPQIADLPETGEKYDLQLSFEAAIVDGPDAGTQLIYKTTAHGGKEFVGKVAQAINAQLEKDPANVVPELALSTSHYKHKKFGKIYKPAFEVMAWSGGSEDSTPEPEKTEEPEEAPAPTTSRRRRR